MENVGVTKKPFDSRFAFGVFLDNLLELSAARTRALLFLYATLYKGVLVSDSWLMTCTGLREILQQKDGGELIACGGLVPVRRKNMETFSDFYANATEKKMHALIKDDDFPTRLDEMTKGYVAEYDLGIIGPAYQQMSQQVLSADVLLTLGATEETVATVQRLGTGTTNTHVKDVICPAIADRVQSQLVMDAARAPYSLNLPVNLGSSIAGPDDYQGHKVLAAMRGPKRELASVDVSPKALAEKLSYTATITDPQVHWMLKEATLASMNAEDLAELRSHGERQPYLAALSAYLANPENANWQSLAVALQNYLSKGANTLITRWMKTGRFGEELRDGAVKITADGTLRIEAPDKPIEMSGIAMTPGASTVLDATADLCIVGRTVTVPEAPPPES